MGSAKFEIEGVSLLKFSDYNGFRGARITM